MTGANLWMTSSPRRADEAPTRRGKRARPPTLPRTSSREPHTQSRVDSLVIPLALAVASFVIFLVTRAGFHTFDGIAYVRDIDKPLSALVLPHHLLYEPLVLGFYRVWQMLGWTGQADAPAQMLSSLAGAGGLAIFYKLAWEWSRSRIASLLAALLLALTYGYWFYSVEVDIYLPPLFFLLVAAWLLSDCAKRPNRGSIGHFYLVGLAHACAVLMHQAALFLVPAFALGLWLIPGERRQKIANVARYGAGLLGVVIPAYLFAGTVIAGQSTPDTFLRWINSYGSLGTWGVLSADTPSKTLSGISAAISAEFWTGRVMVVGLAALLVASAVRSIRRGGAYAWFLWAWTAIYFVFFTWWQPEVLKFWVLALPAPFLLVVLAWDWERLEHRLRLVALAAGIAALLTLLVTNAPEIWAKRDPMSDPARRMSDALAQMSGREDLIVLQASGAEHYLPFYYDRINIMSTRELWYLLGGASGREAAIASIKERATHALAKGAQVWVEDRVLTPGSQAGDRYVFSADEIKELLDLYGEAAQTEKVSAGPESFYLLSPSTAYSKADDWLFTGGREGWTGVNLAEERFASEGWCFAPQEDPNLYGPPLRLDASKYGRVEIYMNSDIRGNAQLFYRESPEVPYSEDRSISFGVEAGTQTYAIDLKGAPGWSRTIEGLRFDPLERGVPSSPDNRVCVKEVRLLP